jgi:hypothetical protein
MKVRNGKSGELELEVKVFGRVTVLGPSCTANISHHLRGQFSREG